MAATKPARPEWADRLERLRQSLGLSQAALAKRLDVSPMAPSRWERGINEPPADVYLELGKMAGHPGCWYFWEHAGLKKSDVAAVMPKAVKSMNGGTEVHIQVVSPTAKPSAQNSMAAIPIYTATSPVGCEEPADLIRKPAEYVIALKAWTPRAEATFCLQMAADRMSPMMEPGAIFSVDESQADINRLIGKLVLAHHVQYGFIVHWLQRYGKSEMLVPENKSYGPKYIQNKDWVVLGRVLWWFSKAP